MVPGGSVAQMIACQQMFGYVRTPMSVYAPGVLTERVREFTAGVDADYVAPDYRGFPRNLPAPTDDGLSTLEIRPHSRAKLEAVGKFSNAYSQALKNKGGTAYVDFFAGPGLLRDAVSKKLEWGTPQIPLQCPAPFNTVVLVEKDGGSSDALLSRVRTRARRGEHVVVINDSAEAAIDEVIRKVPNGAFALALVDPFRIEFSLDAVRRIATARRVDLILLFADGMDLKRNLDLAMAGDTAHAPRFNAAFGGDDWRGVVVAGEPVSRSAAKVIDLYKGKLRSIGFSHFGKPFVVKNSREVEVYQLLYATRADLGVRLWDECTRPQQMVFDF
jgi:three-Cys-motif partner protein